MTSIEHPRMELRLIFEALQMTCGQMAVRTYRYWKAEEWPKDSEQPTKYGFASLEALTPSTAARSTKEEERGHSWLATTFRVFDLSKEAERMALAELVANLRECSA